MSSVIPVLSGSYLLGLPHRSPPTACPAVGTLTPKGCRIQTRGETQGRLVTRRLETGAVYIDGGIKPVENGGITY